MDIEEVALFTTCPHSVEGRMSEDLRIRVLCVTALGLLLLVNTAFAQQIAVRRRPNTNFSKYHTYKWVTIPQAEVTIKHIDERIKKDVDSQMSAKGFKVVENSPDLFLAYEVSIHQKNGWYAFQQAGEPRWDELQGEGDEPTAIVEGELVLDVYDSSTKQLLWHGRAKKALEPHHDQETRQKNLDETIRKLMSKFPPKQSQ